jgi:phosphatidylserine/phosphatidylglycerophosphate/cardiolipin synthase-like enzyme
VKDEVTLAALDPAFGAAMEVAFLADLEHSRELTPDAFARRGTWQKLKERVASLLSRWL